MRVAKLVLALVILSALVLPFGAASAQEALTYGSAFQLQNLEDSNATITIKFYNQGGGVDATVNDTIAAGSANNYFAVQVEDLPESFTGSAGVSPFTTSTPTTLPTTPRRRGTTPGRQRSACPW